MKTEKYWHKNMEDVRVAEKLAWNFPVQKTGTIAVVGGHAGSFSTPIKIAGYIGGHYKFLYEIDNYLPDAIKDTLPPFSTLLFYPSTESGSFKKSLEFTYCLNEADFGLFIGDFSKNSETAIAVGEALRETDKPVVITRDTVDLVAQDAEGFIFKDNVIIIASLAQLQKLFKAVFYPRMVLLTQPLAQIVETLHKFTLTYPVTILTYHEGKFLVAQDGEVFDRSADKTYWTPVTVWNGKVAAKTSVFYLFNPEHAAESLLAALE